MDYVEISSIADAESFTIGPGRPLALIAGPCVLESDDMAQEVALTLREITSRIGIPYIFKASFDKANRTSLNSYRGPGIEKGLKMLGNIRNLGIPVISDIHETGQVEKAAEVLDVLQIPAFLCRQTDLLLAAARTGKPISLKKGQFLSPWDMEHAVKKIKESGNSNLLLTERGTTLGYNNLVVDMRSFQIMHSFGCPVVYDATHSVQLPGGAGGSSGGQREFIPTLTRAAVAAGIDALFMEVHPDPDRALCDGPNSIPLDQMEPLLVKLVEIHKAVQTA
ncbi:MAG: 3-deoxy-8-phosphooctulonate synthase [Desulfobulbaceae bacterium]|nr:3-deoxy-8-phosphooctulonate synthase [Desulfobulbaceae bacterium]MCK5340309.1 3-deoxy-8-phosphooctulonate synthase [Desulfobulbaceae bacterium]